VAYNNAWNAVFSNNSWGRYPAEDLVRFIARNFYNKDRKDIRILEIGCGPGGNLWFFAREGFATYGVDGSKLAIDASIERLDLEIPGWQGEILQHDFCNKLPFNDGFFDAIIDNEAVCCNDFEVSKDIYSDCYRVLRESGKIFVRTFTTNSEGCCSGSEVSYNAYLTDDAISKGIDYIRFTSEQDIKVLLSDFSIETLDVTNKSNNGELDRITEEWIIVAKKK